MSPLNCNETLLQYHRECHRTLEEISRAINSTPPWTFGTSGPCETPPIPPMRYGGAKKTCDAFRVFAQGIVLPTSTTRIPVQEIPAFTHHVANPTVAEGANGEHASGRRERGAHSAGLIANNDESSSSVNSSAEFKPSPLLSRSRTA